MAWLLKRRLSLALFALVSVVLALRCSSATGAEDDATAEATAPSTIWPMFHHDLQRTGQSQFDTSANTGAERWKFATTGGDFNSSPAVGADGTIYVGSGWPDDSLYAISPGGNLKWKFATGGFVESSPAVNIDGTIYVGSNDGNLYAINPDGNQKWKFIGVGVSPAVGTDGTIYVGGSDDSLFAINPDGSLKWKFVTGDIVNSSPAVGADGTIYVSSEEDNVYAINPDGSQKWKFAMGEDVEASPSSPAVGADGTIYVGSFEGNLYALNSNVTTTCGTPPNTYTCPTLKWKFAAGYLGVQSSPAVGADGTIYVGSMDGNLHAVGPTATLSPPSLSFGTRLVGITSAAQKVTLANRQVVTLGISGISTSGDFRVSATTCGASLDPGASCTISVTFTPSTTETRTGTLTVNDSAWNHRQIASLSGVGEVTAELSPKSLSFPTQLVGTTSTVQKATLTNQAKAQVAISSISASGDFGVSSTTCKSPLGPLASCTISVTFRPSAGKTRTGKLTVTDSATNSPQTTSLSGIGTWVVVSPTSLEFGNQKVHTSSAAKKVTFTNKGRALIIISGIGASGDFAASSTTCGSSLGAGASCKVSVTFTPSTTGSRNGTLTVTASNPFPTVPLHGTGVD
ncbi:MAG: PQQ-binding-like beta-propeller repeat protein [Candidatus Binataceae bacterium]